MVATWSGCANLAPVNWTMQHEAEEWFYTMTEQESKMAHTLAILTLWSI